MIRTAIPLLLAFLFLHLSCFSQVFLPNWPSANSYVRALAFDTVHDRLFIAGDFTTLGNHPRSRLAAIDIQTGTVSTFDPDVNESVFALCIHDSVLYIGGMFSQVSGQPRPRLAAFNTNTLELLAWAPIVSNLPVRALAMDGSDLLVGGNLGSVDGEPRPFLAKFDMPGGEVSTWDAGVSNGPVKSICVQDDAIFLAGGYFIIGGVPRPMVAKLDRTTGSLLPWNAHFIGDEANSLAIQDTTVWVGGSWDSVQGSQARGVASLDISTAGIECTIDEPDGAVLSLSVSPDRVFVGGGFHSLGTEERVFAALLSVADCVLDTTNFGVGDNSPAHQIMAVGMRGDLLVAGGYFDTEGGNTHHNLAAWWLDEMTIGMPTWEEALTFRIWPNPCGHDLFLSACGHDAVSMKVANILGEVVLAMPVQLSVNIGGLPVGIYSIQILSSNGACLNTARFLKE